MLRFTRRCLVPFLILFLALGDLGIVYAARGIPGSPEFGVGAILYPDGSQVKEALTMAGELGLDWLDVPVSWSAVQPDVSATPDLEKLDEIIAFAAEHQISVMVSLKDAPSWARTAQGPDAGQVLQLVILLARRYPVALEAIELFPGANTAATWGSPASPENYTSLFRTVQDHLRGMGSPILLVAAGLSPLAANPPAGDMDDLEFLKGLYQNGASSLMPVISVQYGDVTGDPLVFTDGSEHRVLRHYEEVRQVMFANQHQSGMIWITRLSPPSGKISVSDSAYQDIYIQSNWMEQAYIQTRSQLYVGLTIAQSLNPGPEGAATEVPSLLQRTGGIHPFFSALRDIISLNKTGSVTIKPGRPKEGNFSKPRSQ